VIGLAATIDKHKDENGARRQMGSMTETKTDPRPFHQWYTRERRAAVSKVRSVVLLIGDGDAEGEVYWQRGTNAAASSKHERFE
jgi:hypothetical protein